MTDQIRIMNIQYSKSLSIQNITQSPLKKQTKTPKLSVISVDWVQPPAYSLQRWGEKHHTLHTLILGLTTPRVSGVLLYYS